ncbi:unnamed protein product [Clonostachys rosea]|uniref:Protein kinase domain-containing protein n=1 Tax=Bionectria ochroleuca TaxID=29856 RepID=A0ABY6TUL3_BIOOC|nr:unnamed protein product [Clonostachys rosea]
MSDNKPQLVKSLQDLEIVESYDPGATKPKKTTFFHITKDEEVYFGKTSKSKFDTTIDEFNAALQRIPDEEIYPEAPKDVQLTIAPSLTNEEAWVKRPGLTSYDSFRGTEFVPQSMLEETLIMERISRSPHPTFVKYYGCHVTRGRITSIYLEWLDQTLAQAVGTPEFDKLDKVKFIDAVKSALAHLHSLGLAHNDINPHNIMIKDGMPVLIDFGSCQSFGGRLQSLGTVGWCNEQFFTSAKEHDEFGVNKLRDWIQSPE